MIFMHYWHRKICSESKTAQLSFKVYCSWTDHVRNEEVWLRVNEQRNILHEVSKRKANWIGHILRRNCLLKQVIEGKINGEMEVTRRRGRRRKKLLDDLKDRRGYSYLKEETLDRAMWRNRFGGGFGPVVRQNTEWMNVAIKYTSKPRLATLLRDFLHSSTLQVCSVPALYLIFPPVMKRSNRRFPLPYW